MQYKGNRKIVKNPEWRKMLQDESRSYCYEKIFSSRREEEVEDTMSIVEEERKKEVVGNITEVARRKIRTEGRVGFEEERTRGKVEEGR